jgi:phosphohistidine swiveling domain-containing protein
MVDTVADMSIFYADDAYQDTKDNRLEGLIGGKAANLWALGQSFPIPAWFAVTGSAFLDNLTPEQVQAFKSGAAVRDFYLMPELERAIADAAVTLAAGGHKLAVRSSAIGEDGASASYAGQLQSFLNIEPADVPAYVLKVWASAFADSVAAYQTQKSETVRLVPAVLVQVMLSPYAAGVAFGCDPVTGNMDICVINATPGLGDKLVGGEENGVLYYVPRDPAKTVTGDDPLLSITQLRAIERLLWRAEAHFGTPQDMEWGIQDSRLYLLQARPITTLKAAAGEEIVWDNSNIVESYSGVTSPLTFSFARYVYAHVYIGFCGLMGVAGTQITANHNRFFHMLGYVRGHIYYHLVNWYRLLALFPGFKMNRAFMEQMMGVKTPLPAHIVDEITGPRPDGWARFVDGMRFARTLLGLLWHQIRLPMTMRRFYARLNQALGGDKTDSLDLEGLAKAYRTLEAQLLSHWDAPLINDFLCMIAFGLSRKQMEKFGAEAGLQYHADFMIGQGDIISAEPARLMREMADLLTGDAAAISAFIDADDQAIASTRRRIPEIDQRLDAYLSKFSDRCLQELKLESPTLRDDASTLFRAIGHMARAGHAEIADKQSLPELANVIGHNPLRLWWVKALLNWARSGVRQRENLRFERTRVFGRVRLIFVTIGEHLTRAGFLDTPHDIFLLEVEEVLGFIEGTSTLITLKELADLRRVQQQNFKDQLAPPSRFISHCAMGIFLNGPIMPDLSAVPQGVDGDSLKGLGCCRGTIRGKVRVIADPKGAHLERGEIMVAQFTDPGWITLFVNASGILVERGSLLSHSAIVAREMNIPAIVALDGVMDWLATGDWVEMDGATGIVRKLDA